jgi:hypothetical protein
MRTDRRTLTALFRPLNLLLGYADRVTERADGQARSAGLTVERVGRWRRCYRAPHMNSHAGSAANPDITPTAAARKLISTPWSTPTLTTSRGTATAAAGWVR